MADTVVTSGQPQTLRPRRFAAPALARLIRHCESPEQLIAVLQEHSSYFDTSHIGIALTHLALLLGRQQQQQQQQTRSLQAGATAPGDSPAASIDAAAVAAAVGAAGLAASSVSASIDDATLLPPAAARPPAAPAPAAVPAYTVALRLLLRQALARLDEMDGPGLARVMSALAAMRFRDKLVLEQMVQVASLKFVSCRPADLANLISAAASLGVPLDYEFRASFYASVRAIAKKFGPRELAVTLWAYGACGADVPEDAVKVLLARSRPKLGKFGPLYLVKAIQGLAALRYRPPPDWMDAYCAALRGCRRRLSTRQLCAVMLALASLQVALDGQTRGSLLVHTFQIMPSMPPPELALSVWSLGQLQGGGDLPALIDLDKTARVLDLTYATMHRFSAAELQQLLEGLTRLALQPPLEWMQRFVGALQPRLAELPPRQLAGVLGSLAAQQYKPRPEMAAGVLAATQANMQQLLADTTVTASLVNALRRLAIEPPPSWVEALMASSRSALKNRCADLHLAALAASLAAWRVAPDGRWVARLVWRSQVLMQQGRMSPGALAALLQAFVALRVAPNPVWVRLCLKCALGRASHRSFAPHHYGTLLTSLHALGVRPPRRWLLALLLSTYRCWGLFGMQHWSSLLPALALYKLPLPRAWLLRFERTTAPRLAECSPLQLLALVVPLAQLAALGGSWWPGDAWMDAWWASSGTQLRRLQYSLNELQLTCAWLAALRVQPPLEWLAACADACRAYQPALSLGEQQCLAAALALLLVRAPAGASAGAGAGAGAGGVAVRSEGAAQGMGAGQDPLGASGSAAVPELAMAGIA